MAHHVLYFHNQQFKRTLCDDTKKKKKKHRTFGRSQHCIHSCKDLTYQLCSMSLLWVKELEFEGKKMLTIIENIQKQSNFILKKDIQKT